MVSVICALISVAVCVFTIVVGVRNIRQDKRDSSYLNHPEEPPRH